MIGNVVDRRTNPYIPEVDVVFEPSFHDNIRRSDGTPVFADASEDPAYFIVTADYDTTLRAAVLRAKPIGRSQ
jgi:hypothetical protein